MSTEILAQTVTAALEVATGPKGPAMVQIAPRSYQIHRWDSVREIWRVGHDMDYHKARAAWTEARHYEALIAAGWTTGDAEAEAHQFAYGSLRERVARSFAKAKGGAA